MLDQGAVKNMTFYMVEWKSRTWDAKASRWNNGFNMARTTYMDKNSHGFLYFG